MRKTKQYKKKPVKKNKSLRRGKRVLRGGVVTRSEAKKSHTITINFIFQYIESNSRALTQYPEASRSVSVSDNATPEEINTEINKEFQELLNKKSVVEKYKKYYTIQGTTNEGSVYTVIYKKQVPDSEQ